MSKAMYMSKVCVSLHLHDLLNFLAFKYNAQLKSNGCDHTIIFAQKNIRNAPIFLHNKKSDFPCQKQCMFKDGVYICMIC